MGDPFKRLIAYLLDHSATQLGVKPYNSAGMRIVTSGHFITSFKFQFH